MFQNDALLFTVPALLGTVVFVLKLTLMLFAGIGGDMDAETGLDGAGGDASADAFKLVSLHTIAAFLMGFGWGGLMGRLVFDFSTPVSVLCGLLFGSMLMWMLAGLLAAVMRLQGSGHVRLEDAVGLEGTVYTRVPSARKGTGSVHVVIDERARIMTAVTDGAALERHARVRVTSIGSDRTVTVVGESAEAAP